ncbi:MAG: SDR family NAD(P)-dependent oxidoreductase, partial [Proteobacteria bacterium]|nr:SDR family NAD(P)-dependent oxidoreductase [Pseudomonadota bacterium]
MLDRSAVSLEGKVAIVTGGGGGMGRSISETFAAYGALIVVAEQDAGRAEQTVAAIEERGGRALAQVIDVRIQAQVDTMVAAAVGAFGRIDVLVNLVGDYLGRGGAFVRSSEDDWEVLYDINLKQVFRCTRAVLPHMLEHGDGGSIIHFSTIEAFRGIPGAAVYSAFNSALTGFTKSLALELGPVKIRVNAIAPETTDTLQLPVHRWIPDEHK